jgi:hypothetical protein
MCDLASSWAIGPRAVMKLMLANTAKPKMPPRSWQQEESAAGMNGRSLGNNIAASL